jgi:putative oxidoreductase
MNFDLSIQLFTKWGIPFPTLSTELAAATEILGGIALILGVGVFYAALPLAFTILVAIYFVHGPAGFWLPNGYEFALAVLVSVLAVGLSGPGALALQKVFARNEFAQPPEGVRRAA